MEQENNIFDYLKIKKGFTPDASYFENLAKEVIQKESNTKQKEQKIVPLYKKPIFWLVATAASIALLFVLSNNLTTGNDDLLAFDQITSSEALAYVNDNIDEFDAYLLSEYVSDNQLKEEKIDVVVELIATETTTIKELEKVELDDILDYLEYEELDIDELEDELYI
ncbi:MAG TPA: hypothetical protein EYG86_01025 [Crocinitomicaceae bacterium]|nr:hypothetical protein [Crocinitomicaceae bacterium]